MQKEKLIIIDDKIEGLIPITKYLEKTLDIVVSCFDNVETAITNIKEKNNVFAILLDIKMPEMSGTEAAKIIIKNNIEIPVIFFTEVTPNTEFLHEAYSLGIVDYIIKPVTSEEKEIIKNKLSVFLKMSIYKHQLELELQNTQKINRQKEENFKNYKSLIDNIKLAYLVTNTDFKIIETNEQCNNIDNFQSQTYLKEYIAEEHLDKFQKATDKLKAQYQLQLNKNNINLELKLNNNKIISMTGNIHNAQEEHYIFLVQDITEEKIIEMQEKIQKEYTLKEIQKSIRRISSKYEII